ncbi:hypothetical protein SLUN_11440 [Streptomyces lunaelactis]|uniref:Metallo-beta-lactamase domain-containing protein n=1 Tax=Streptomyces lunaelactis TaxID=1535768 RepID=A0A2R4TE33_9ACTN|nr:hypothetical protein SLUN_11440 [Streptomyces lunaelactis]NUK89016.1 MBL fold metallo-hydrolase [Streptomyces lunaelactis]
MAARPGHRNRPGTIRTTGRLSTAPHQPDRAVTDKPGEKPAAADSRSRGHQCSQRSVGQDTCWCRFEDSIDPVHRAGQTLLWETSHRIDGNIRLEPAPGHTPGSAVLHLRSGTERALFVGDLIHTPLQILEPHVDTCLSADQQAAANSRRRVLEYAADTNALLIPAHFTGPGAAEVRRDGSSFAIKKWAPFSAPRS